MEQPNEDRMSNKRVQPLGKDLLGDGALMQEMEAGWPGNRVFERLKTVVSFV